MIRAARLAALILPLVGLAGLWLTSDRTYHRGTEWDVPIQGYDPRDYLRGHYIEFTYDWPGIETRDIAMQPETLCLGGQAPRLDTVFTAGDPDVCTHPITIEERGVYGSNALMTGRLYIGQDRAEALQQQLQDQGQRGIVTIRQREDGSFTPISIRFRPLTPAEIAERDAPGDAPFDPLGPPAVMGREP